MKRIGGFAKTRRDRAATTCAEEKFRLAVEACPSGMVMTDEAGSIVLVNTETERLFGYQRHELIGRPMQILLPERLRGDYFRHRDSFVRGPQATKSGTNLELFGLRRDGSEFPVEVRLNPIRAREGLLLLGVIVDTSERTRIERVKDEFVSTVSHELRTPLTSISGSLGLLIGGAAGKLPDPAVRLLTIAQNNSQRLVRLINDILDIEKIECGQTAFSFRRTHARTLVEQVIEANRGYAEGFGVRVRLDPAAMPSEVYVDPDRLAQVITNLLSNAIKFSPPDGEVEVAIEEQEHAGAVRIAVRDHGPGIPAYFKPRVFKKFAQADGTDARQKGGTGLGLSIVKQIVARLGEHVGFDDAEGGGTVFHIELPGWVQVSDREIDAQRTADAVRILLCEDDPDAAIALREGLRPFGFSTDFAYDAAGLIERACGNGYAAIVVDLKLADADAVGLIHRLRGQPEIYKTPIVIMSSGGDFDKTELEKLPALEWMQKPVDIDRLVQIIERACAGAGGGRPRILHVDDDHDVLDLVAGALQPTASVVSVDSLDKAREALPMHDFDLAVLDITLGPSSGLDLLAELRRRDGRPLPVIIFSAHAAEPAPDAQVQAILNKARASLDDLLAAVHDRLMLKSAQPEVEVA